MRMKKPKSPRDWRISVIGAEKVYLGRVDATDKDSAIDKAMEEFKVDPARRFRPIAEPVE